MTRFYSLRRVTLALTLLGVHSLIVPLPAAQAESFQASGAYEETHVTSTAHGTLAGAATPGGAFIGHFRESVRDGGTLLDGRATLDFGNGDTLTFDYLLVKDPAAGLYLGSYVIHHGTGTLKGATGGGDMAATPSVQQEGLFSLDGELFLK